ncbi:hypothetical protein F5Y19DRAFT_419743 [Xylariaceae sp. FL1651]|nr:hypothetical protein F5Y19DRAFT_419743 [Xylariaceae sp. FL1651]
MANTISFLSSLTRLWLLQSRPSFLGQYVLQNRSVRAVAVFHSPYISYFRMPVKPPRMSHVFTISGIFQLPIVIMF